MLYNGTYRQYIEFIMWAVTILSMTSMIWIRLHGMVTFKVDELGGTLRLYIYT